MANKPLTQDQLAKVDAKLKIYMTNKASWVKRYGKDAESVMRGRAINTVKKETESMNQQNLKELVRKTLQQESDSKPITFDETRLFDNLFTKRGEELKKKGIAADGNALMHQFKTKKTLENIDKKLSLYDLIFSEGFSPEERKNYDYNLIKYFETPQFSVEDIQSDINTSKDYMSLGDAVRNQLDKYDELKQKQRDLDETKKATRDFDGDGEIESSEEEYKGVRDKAIKKAKGVKEDIDLGHEDNEPHMIKGELYQIGKYAMDLYAILEELEEAGGEYDFPAWWQSKITTAKNMMSGAKHYLDFELKEPAIDAAVDALTGEEPHMGEPMPPMMEGEVTKTDELAAKIAKALKANKEASDQNNLKQARIALNKGNEEAAEKIAKPYIDEDVVPGSNIKKDSKGKWRVLSGKTGKMWPQTYDSKKDAKDALQAYHANK